MNFFSRLLKRSKVASPITCPRCLGKGHVDKDDIIRLKQQGKWKAGACAYCKGVGTVNKEILSKVPANASYLTTNLSEAEREAIVNNTQREDCPVSEHSRLWLEDALLILLDLFGKENVQQRRVLTPHHSHFPISYDGTEASAYETMKIVAAQMDVPFESITLDYYDGHVQEVSTGSPFGGRIFLQSREDDKNASGLYWGQTEDGKYEIWLNRENLTKPESLVATLAHEIAHIKLLGENRINVNNEPLTDLTTIIFGLGIFNANVAFQTFRNFDSYGWQSNGYLSQTQWGYALALYAYVRGEKSPAWIDHLTPNVKRDFSKGQQFILDNLRIVFQNMPLTPW
ncbi:hypothetical protein Q4E93_18800 [Flavitalea sp. BT771]|uniref:hypothetical protein n=1 Tax=Flavitalea sp. BT771 TaxID=3063329 RepID=UPI0026E18567|nr:hypothetical protein [Flavitalea sp. BT771]MDO6432662.1 hypothetical protein [Flavitalea sp. BT771]MDV6222062.1 hypothetical protein [Flavitalea sp. BT771]